MHRVSGPLLKLLSAVGVIPLPIIMMMERGKSSAQHSRSSSIYDHLHGAHRLPSPSPSRRFGSSSFFEGVVKKVDFCHYIFTVILKKKREWQNNLTRLDGAERGEGEGEGEGVSTA